MKSATLVSALQAALDDYQASRERLKETFEAAYKAEAWKDMGFTTFPYFPSFVRAEQIDGGLGTTPAALMAVFSDDAKLYKELAQHLPASDFEMVHGGRHRLPRVDVRLTPAAFIDAIETYFTEEQKSIIRQQQKTTAA